MFIIKQAVNEFDIAAAKEMFVEYERYIGLDLCFQNFDEEVSTLPGKYAPPEGRLLLAYPANINEPSEGSEVNYPIGCVALRGLSEPGICEMKRLFVRPQARNSGVGKILIERIIHEAISAGYKKMRLDTFPAKMAKAIDLYRSYGFYTIPKYYDNPMDGVLFMESDLTRSNPASKT